MVFPLESKELASLLDIERLHEATKSLLGYFVHRKYREYLNMISKNLVFWHTNGFIDDSLRLTGKTKQLLVPFDFTGIDLTKISYINGVYFYIFSCHKWANNLLMNRFNGKQVLYLRGYDYEGTVHTGGDLAMNYFSASTQAFNHVLAENISPHFPVFKIISPKDIYWETVAASKHFFSDFVEIKPFTTYPFRSVYLNALRWKEDISKLFDRMDYFIVYLSSITEGVVWELQQLSAKDRRNRVTVVFDEKAIDNKKLQLYYRDKMQEKFGEKVIWSKKGSSKPISVEGFRKALSEMFLVTTPEAFKKNIKEHQQRITKSSAKLPPGKRETYLEFHFHPAIDTGELKKIRDLSALVQSQIEAQIDTKGIDFMPLFMNYVQLRIFLTLLLGEHHDTGRALAVYAGIIQTALDYFSLPGKKPGDLSKKGRKQHLAMLEQHYNMASNVSYCMLAYGKSYEFNNFSRIATTEYNKSLEKTEAAMARFFKEKTGISL